MPVGLMRGAHSHVFTAGDLPDRLRRRWPDGMHPRAYPSWSLPRLLKSSTVPGGPSAMRPFAFKSAP